MSALLDIVAAWEQFNQQHPSHSAAEFYEHALAQHFDNKAEVAAGNGPATTEQASELLRTLGRIGSAFALYHRAAMAQTALPTPESFYYLNAVNSLGEVRKTELITYLFAEYTTGMEAISRLLTDHLIHERPDPTDKRAKLISLTKKGTDLLKVCQKLSAKAAEMIFGQLSPADIAHCQRLLQPIEQRHSQLATTLKGELFNTMYDKATGKA